MRAERMLLAFCSSARRFAVNPRPARFIKYVSIRIPDPGPFGETFLEARVRAMVAALFVNNPDGGCVESVLTVDTHLFPVRLGIKLLCKSVFTSDQQERLVDVVLDSSETIRAMVLMPHFRSGIIGKLLRWIEDDAPPLEQVLKTMREPAVKFNSEKIRHQDLAAEVGPRDEAA